MDRSAGPAGSRARLGRALVIVGLVAAPLAVRLYGVRALPGSEVTSAARAEYYARALPLWAAALVLLVVIAMLFAPRLLALGRRWAGELEASRRARWLAALALLVAAALPRLLFLEADAPTVLLPWPGDFGTDEGVWSYLATELAAGRDPSAGPEVVAGAIALPYTLLQAGVTGVLGTELWTVRLANAVLGAALAPLTFLASRRWLGAAPALFAGLTMASSFYLVVYQRVGFVDATLAFFSAAVVFVWLGARGRVGLAVGVALGAGATLALATKLSAAPLGLGILAAFAVASLERERRPRLTGWLGLVAGGVLVLAAVALVYGSNPAWLDKAVAGFRGTGSDLAGSARELWSALRRALRREPLWTHAPVAATLGYAGLVLASVRLVRGPRRDPTAALLVVWWLAATLMLAVYGYIPSRYYLGKTVPLVLLAASFAHALWGWVSRRGGPRALAALLAVLLTDTALSWGQTAHWLAQRRHTQRDAGRAIAAMVAREGGGAVAGPWAFNLALAGHFEARGYRSPRHIDADTAAREGSRFLLRNRHFPAYVAPPAGPDLELFPMGELCYYCVPGEQPNLVLYRLERRAPPGGGDRTDGSLR